MEKPSRFVEIDVLRGIAVFAMILIHVNYFFISQKIPFILWNYSQFAVPVFIFCSSYLFFKKGKDSFGFSYFKKRILRLMVPYWIFLVAFIPLVYLFEPKKINLRYIFNSIISTGGVDISWLVLLFIVFTFIFPLIVYLKEKHKIVFVLYSLASFFVPLYLVFFSMKIDYKFIMWLPWSLIAVFSIFFIKFGHKKWFFSSILAGSLVLYLALAFVQVSLGHVLSFVNNKYPPNLYFLAFGFFAITLLFWLAKKGFFKPVTKIVSFLSLNSYSIYFIHYFILYVCRIFFKILPWYGLFLLVFISTILVQIFVNKLNSLRS